MKSNKPSYKSKPVPQDTKSKETTRLNKFLSNAGICSRREADAHIAMGLVHVNGKIMTSMGYQVKPTDEVKYDGQRIQQTPPVFILLNKPKGFVATTQGGKMNKSVQELILSGVKTKVPALGDMGRPVTGLLLFTNDESIRKKWNNSKAIYMLYHIVLDKNMTVTDMDRLKKGVLLRGKSYKVSAVSHAASGDKREIGVEVNAIPPGLMTKILAHLEYKVIQMDRVLLGGLTKKDLPRGNWRRLTTNEINFLKMMK